MNHGARKVGDDEIATTLQSVGIDTDVNKWAIAFAKEFGATAAQKAVLGDRTKPVKDIYGTLGGGQYPGSRNLTMQEMINTFKAEKGFAEGGIATGPKTGYKAMLHGTEAIVPLEGSSGIPVDMQGQSKAMDEQVGLLREQVSKMDQMIAVLTQNNSTSRKILSSSYS